MSTSEGQGSRSWTVRLRTRLARTVPPGQLLPDRQPAYVRSWIYVFGVASLAALLYVIASGLILALKGVAWWHTSSVGHFVNSTHLWSVELFFFCMVVHLWGKFFMAAWRGNRGLTWVTGAVAFLGSIGTAFTGYLSQTNFDSQWTAGQAKDGLNAVGVALSLSMSWTPGRCCSGTSCCCRWWSVVLIVAARHPGAPPRRRTALRRPTAHRP